MADQLSLAIIITAGAYLLALAGLCFVSPARAAQFLGRLASSAASHYLEMSIRLAVGLAMIRYAPQMATSTLFHFAGWILVVTTGVLMMMPWHWHRRIALRAVPLATTHLVPFALASAACGVFVLMSALGSVS